MIKIQLKLLGLHLIFEIGRKEPAVSLEELEQSIKSAVLRTAKKDLSWNSNSWFQINLSSRYKNKTLRVIDLTGSLPFSSYTLSEDNIYDLLRNAKKNFDEIR